MNDTYTPRRDAICPSCKGQGVPTATTVGKDGRTMSYRCPACAHTWNITHPYRGFGTVSSD